MNILSISSILPIPGIISYNDFVFQIYNHYKLHCKADTITIIKPVKRDFNIARILRKKTRLILLGNNFSRNIFGYQVEIFPYYSIWSLKNIHAIITGSIYFLNKKKIDKLFNKNKFGIIHAQYIFPDGLLAYQLHKRFNIPYVITSHNERFYFDHRISRNIALKIFRNASMVFPINYTNFQSYKSRGITNIDYKPLGFDKNFIRDQKKWSGDTVHIFSVCNLILLKNLDKVISVIKLLVEKYNIHYTIIGSGPERNSLFNQTVILGIADKVRFIDHIPYEKIAEEMSKYDIFIMPSYFETFGRVYFEAMAMGIPVICAKNSGISGFFKEKDEGISVDHKNISEIHSALEYLIVNPAERARIGLNGKKLVEKFTWDNVALDLNKEYRTIVDSFNSQY